MNAYLNSSNIALSRVAVNELFRKASHNANLAIYLDFEYFGMIINKQVVKIDTTARVPKMITLTEEELLNIFNTITFNDSKEVGIADILEDDILKSIFLFSKGFQLSKTIKGASKCSKSPILYVKNMRNNQFIDYMNIYYVKKFVVNVEKLSNNDKTLRSVLSPTEINLMSKGNLPLAIFYKETEESFYQDFITMINNTTMARGLFEHVGYDIFGKKVEVSRQIWVTRKGIAEFMNYTKLSDVSIPEVIYNLYLLNGLVSKQA